MISAAVWNLVPEEASPLQVKLVLVEHGDLVKSFYETARFEMLLGTKVNDLIIVEALWTLNLLTLDLINPVAT